MNDGVETKNKCKIGKDIGWKKALTGLTKT